MDAFDFTVLFHTYFRVDDIANVEISSLRDCEYIDKVQEGCLENEPNKIVKIAEEVDR
jgi:glucose-6-phosphate 1-epimerase